MKDFSVRVWCDCEGCLTKDCTLKGVFKQRLGTFVMGLCKCVMKDLSVRVWCDFEGCLTKDCTFAVGI